MATTPTYVHAPTLMGGVQITPLIHSQGCRGYLLVDAESKDALALDVHLDQFAHVLQVAGEEGYALRWVVDSHTHADHPSASAELARRAGARRVTHARAGHKGVAHVVEEGDGLQLGDRLLAVRHTPGHTPDHIALEVPGAVFSGDSLFIGGVARADFLGGDAGELFDSIQRVYGALPADTMLFPGHDYKERTSSTLGEERRANPWLAMASRDRFVSALKANAPPEPANMAALLSFNRDGLPIPTSISAQDTIACVAAGGAGSIIDVRTLEEVEAGHIPGSRHIDMEQVLERVAEIQATPAPRLILCRIGRRAEAVRQALAERLGMGGMSVIAGGILAYAKAGGEVTGGQLDLPPSAGGCCAAAPPTD